MRIVFLIFFILGYFFSTPRLSQAADQTLILNEIMPKPDDETEWIEIYNPTDQTIDLTGWQIKDGNSSSTDDLSLNGQVGPLEYKVFEHAKGWLNDSGTETVTLLNNTTTVDSYSYEGASQGKTFGRQPDGSSWTTNLNPSKGASNGYPPTPTSTPTFTPTPTSTPTDTPTPTKTPTPSPKPTSTPTPKPSLTSTPKKTPTPSENVLGAFNSPTPNSSSILGTSSSAASIQSEVKIKDQQFESPLKNLVIFGGGLVFILSGTLLATFIKKH